jgi:hypothetical protein
MQVEEIRSQSLQIFSLLLVSSLEAIASKHTMLEKPQDLHTDPATGASSRKAFAGSVIVPFISNDWIMYTTMLGLLGCLLYK